jgi:hypothetical protein
MSKEKKIVKITENSLVDLIDNIVSEAVELEKQKWIAEQEAKKATMLESKVIELEKQIKSLTESK